jgi:hypothetical protein
MPVKEKNDVFNPNDVYSIAVNAAAMLQDDFFVDDCIKPTMKALCLYFANDIRFETEGFGKLKKGIMLVGNVGVGKTLLMKAFKDNPKRYYNVRSTSSIVDGYCKGGVELIEDYCRGQVSYKPPLAYCFDDLGVETLPAKFMGNSENVMEKIILHRYEQNIPFFYTHFTTNLDGDQIESNYGTRIRSRLREMCNFIEVGGEDRRK